MKYNPDPISSERLWPGRGFWEYVHLDLGYMTFSQVHETPLSHGQQLYEILSLSHIQFSSEELWPGHGF